MRLNDLCNLALSGTWFVDREIKDLSAIRIHKADHVFLDAFNSHVAWGAKLCKIAREIPLQHPVCKFFLGAWVSESHLF